MSTNYDDDTGIHYGVISQHTPSGEAVDEVFHGPHSEDMAYENWREELKARIKNAADDFMSSHYLERFVDYCMDFDDIGECYQGDEINPFYKHDGYHIQKCLDADLIITKSEFYTYAPQCSPCVPNAGNLDDAGRKTKARTGTPEFNLQIMKNNDMKTYCLSHDWFEDGRAPYPVFKVGTDDQEVAP